MNILLVTDSYPPEIRSASHLMLELAGELQTRGHTVTVVTSWPQYNLDSPSVVNSIEKFAVEAGVEVLRVRTLPHHNVNYILRGLAQLLMPFQFLLKLRKYVKRKIDAVIVYSPPLPLALVGTFYKRKGARYLLNVQDIFPQNAIDLNLLKSKTLISFFKKMERWSYQEAGCVAVHSTSNSRLLSEAFPHFRNKIHILHNWIDVNHHRVENNKNFREAFNLEGKMVFLFAGVMGPSQYLDVLVLVAEQLTDISEIVFLLVGDGVERARLQELARQKNLQNVIFKPFVSRDDYPALLDACDVGVVSLSHLNTTPVVPGKLLGYLASGLPVVAFLNAASDGHEIIKDAGCGYSVVSDDVNAAADLVKKMYNERFALENFKRRGQEYVEKHFSQKHCVDHLEALLGQS